MKKMMLITISLFIVVLFGCTNPDGAQYQQAEQPHLYWKDIDVVVTSIDKKHWYASTHWYEVTLNVESEEYDLTKKYTIKESGALNCPKQWDYCVGDIVKARIYSWVKESTGEVVRREINRVL